MSWRIYLSPPHVTGREIELLRDAVASNWIAPLGPHVDAFEAEVAEATGRRHAAALSSGTAALHLALRLLDVGPGDEVVVPTLTFAASAFAVTYVGARPLFVDSEERSWNLDPALLHEALEERRRAGRLPKAVIGVDLYGQCADWDDIEAFCAAYEIPVVDDAAEALGGDYRGRPAGSCGRFGVVSFNGNKIVTTSGGGMLVGDSEEEIARARFLASQARDPAPHYEHSEIGHNYRMSNLLAAVGRAQLEALADRVEARRRIFGRYRELLSDLPGLAFQPEASWGTSTRWLTCLTVEPDAAGTDREEIRLALAGTGIEARPVWKPMHLQPVFEEARVWDRGVAEGLFERGLCLPSGSALTRDQVEEVAGIVRGCWGE